MFDPPDGRHQRPEDMPAWQGERPELTTWRPPYAARGRSRWHWLLLIPIVAPLCVPLYDRSRPELFGIPFFYWCQIALVLLAMAVITLVNLAARKRD